MMDLFERFRRAILRSDYADLIIAGVAGFIAWTLVQCLKITFG